MQTDMADHDWDNEWIQHINKWCTKILHLHYMKDAVCLSFFCAHLLFIK